MYFNLAFWNLMKKDFHGNPKTGSLNLDSLGFSSLQVFGFDRFKAKVGDVVINIIHVGFFYKLALWLKTRARFDR